MAKSLFPFGLRHCSWANNQKNETSLLSNCPLITPATITAVNIYWVDFIGFTTCHPIQFSKREIACIKLLGQANQARKIKYFFMRIPLFWVLWFFVSFLSFNKYYFVKTILSQVIAIGQLSCHASTAITTIDYFVSRSNLIVKWSRSSAVPVWNRATRQPQLYTTMCNLSSAKSTDGVSLGWITAE